MSAKTGDKARFGSRRRRKQKRRERIREFRQNFREVLIYCCCCCCCWARFLDARPRRAPRRFSPDAPCLRRPARDAPAHPPIAADRHGLCRCRAPAARHRNRGRKPRARASIQRADPSSGPAQPIRYPARYTSIHACEACPPITSSILLPASEARRGTR